VLRYFPRNSASVAVVSTDLGDARYRELNGVLGRRLLGAPLRQDVGQAVSAAGVPFDRVVEPLLGNDLAAGVVGQYLVAALQVKDRANMRGLLERSPLKRAGKLGGADFWVKPRGDGGVALDGDVVVASNEVNGLAAAFAARDSRDHLTARDLDAVTGGVDPADAIVRVYSDPHSLIRLRGGPELRGLGRVPYVKAIRSAGFTAAIDGNVLKLGATIATDPRALRAADLPLPPGAATPMLPSVPGRIASAAANQSQTTVFLLNAARAALPRSHFVRDVAALERDLHVDFEREVLRQFAGPSASTIDTAGRFAARSTVADPARLRALLPRIAPRLPRLVEDLDGLRGPGRALLLMFAPDAPVSPGAAGRVRVTRAAGGLYRVGPLRRPGPTQLWFGLRGRTFVVASDLAGTRAIARAPLVPAPAGVHGAAVAAGDFASMPPGRLAEFTALDPRLLGVVRGSMDVTAARLRAAASVELRP
jgi:hypothetical protein